MAQLLKGRLATENIGMSLSKLIDLNAWSPGVALFENIRRGGPVKGGVAWLEEVNPW